MHTLRSHAEVCCDTLTVMSAPETFACPVQILVIDQPSGPANILIDTISLLLNREVTVTSVDTHDDALRALDFYEFDLVVVGVRANSAIQLAILPWLHDARPERPVLVVGRDLPRQYRQYARAYGAHDVLNMPQRAADLKTLARHLAERYLDPSESEPLLRV